MLASGFLSLSASGGAVKTVLEKNKAEPYAASRVFINAILCEERPILSNKNNAEGPDDLDASHVIPTRARQQAAAPGFRFARAARPSVTPQESDEST
jgi:hypothetical protein